MEQINTDVIPFPKLISGVDTLFFFYESTNNYDNFFLDILDQLEDNKGRFDKRDISYENKDLKVSINNQIFEFNGKSKGYYWFTQFDKYFTVGFKDHLTNRGLNDIQVQFNAIGIYTLGLKSLLKYTDDIFKDVVTEYKPITRVDLNMFIQSDLSWLTKDMFVSRKRKYTTHFKEISSKYRLETIYIGSPPYLLRLYDKKEELKNSKKSEMMYEYFLNNGFNREDDIFNLEFEMHRKYLKTFFIHTVDDLLARAEQLFVESMGAIRLVDLSTITENSKNSSNRYKADTHPLWQHISDSYKLKDFLSTQAPLERLKRKSYSYTVTQAIEEHVSLAKKHYIYGGIVDEQFYEEVLDAFHQSKEPVYINTSSIHENKEDKKELIITHENILEPVNLKELSDMELEKYLKTIESNMSKPDLDFHLIIKRHQTALIELKFRGKVKIQDETLF